MLTRNADLIGRLNVFLDLGSPAYQIAEKADPTAWNAQLDKFYWGIFADRNRVYNEKDLDVFHAAATPDGIRAAREGLRGQIPMLKHARPTAGLFPENQPSFELSKQKLYLFVDEEGFFHRYVSSDFPTMVYDMLRYLIEQLSLRPADFLTCGYEKCLRMFVPLRKPHKKARKHFCSQRCGNIVSARESRAKRPPEMKEQENERSHRVYKNRVEKARGRPTRVKRLPRHR